MANFFLIDHSLCKSGGHHYDYVHCVARAADDAGFLTTIGANRELKKLPESELNELGHPENILPVFRQTTYQKDSYLAGLQHLTRSNHDTTLAGKPVSGLGNRLANRINNRLHQRRRNEFVRSFAADCELFFRPLIQSPGDQAFLTTVSELELMGLALFLAKHPGTVQTQWHLQFHFNLFDGRTPEYEGQKTVLEAIRACFLASLARLSYHSIEFYTTSEVLADQYNRLGVGEFKALPYPVSPQFKRAPSSNRSFSVFNPTLKSPSDVPSTRSAVPHAAPAQRLRFTCPGEFRREKGSINYLQPLVDKIWTTHLSTGNVQIVVQRPKRKWHSRRQKIELTLPPATNTEFPISDPVEYFSHPLSQDDYVDLIQSTDCGLLFYDSRVYFSRRAGVLGELLSNGKPVIVPAGSWLAEQIQEPVFEHADKLMYSNSATRTIEHCDFKWNRRNVPMPGGVLSFDQNHHPFEFTVSKEPDETTFVLEFDWHSPTESGVYCRIDVIQKNSSGETIDLTTRTVGFRQSNRKVNAIFPMNRATETIEFSLANAFHDSMASIKNAEIQCLSLVPQLANDLPIGQVGVIANDQNHLPDCVDEIVKHYDHYRSTAATFSKPWYARHAPERTVSELVTAAEPIRRSIRRAA